MKNLILFLFMTSIMVSYGATLEEAKKVYLSGDYAAALPLLQEQYNKNKRNASVNQWIGVSLYKLGRYDEAVKYFEFAKSRKVVEAYRYLAMIDFYKYDFDGASEMFSQYNAELKRLKKNVPEEAQKDESRFSNAKIMLDHVEKIAIIDSIVVDKNEFFKHYRLSSGAGTLSDQNALPFQIPDSTAIVFEPESKSRMLWGMKTSDDIDTTGHNCIYEIQKLYDGSWDKATKLDDAVNIAGDSSYPFMMSDGMTLYYANNGAESIGGYDIFISRKDSESGKFYSPQNIGMPFNSPFDDYMLVIDEFTGVGWWATDRNQIPGMLTIYVYVPNSVRVNYSPEDPNLVSFAKITNIGATWDGNDYRNKLEEIDAITIVDKDEQSDFVFHLRNGVTYTHFDDFENVEARSRMEELMIVRQNQINDVERLKRLRVQYAKVADIQRKALRGEILRLEKKVDEYPDEIEQIENAIRKLEIKNK